MSYSGFVPNTTPQGPGGFAVNAMQNLANLNKQQQQNQYYGPDMQSQIGYRNALASQIPSQVQYQQLINQNYVRDLNAKIQQMQAQSNQSNAQAGYLGTEADINKFKFQHPAYIDLNAWLYDQPLPEASTSNSNPMISSQNNSPTSVNPMTVSPVNPNNNGNSGSGLNNALTSNGLGIGVSGNPKTYGDLIRQNRINQYNSALSSAQQKIFTANAQSFTTLPKEDQEGIIAQGRGAGLYPTETMAEIGKGKTIQQIMQEQGYASGNYPDPIYGATDSDIHLMNQRKASNAEINNLSPIISSAMSPYARTFRGWSPAQVSDALKGSDPDSQAQFLAARGLQNELSAIRLRMANAPLGKNMIRDMVDKSLGTINIYKGAVSPDVYNKAQQYIDKWLTGAVNSANTSISKLGQPGSAQISSNNSAASPAVSQNTVTKTWRRNKNGQLERVS